MTDVEHSIERVRQSSEELAGVDPSVLKDIIMCNRGTWPSSSTLMEYINVYVEDLQRVLDEENARLKPDEWRAVRQQQDAEFEEALRMDQQSAQQVKEEGVQPRVLSAAELRELRAAAAEARMRQGPS
jgi:hypothetical protein